MESAIPSIPFHDDLALESEVLHFMWQKALATLQSLQTPLGVTASGQNDQFHAIFGRDSLWTVLLALEAGRLQKTTAQTRLANAATRGYPSGQARRKERDPGADGSQNSSAISYHAWLHDLSASVLRGLASLQGKIVNDVNEEQPGRIVHEYWNPIPKRMILAGWPVIEGRYYGAFDASFLYLITLGKVDTFFDDRALLEELWPNAEAVLQWMLNWSDLDRDGLVEYKKRNPDGIGLGNQVWKDSSEAIQPQDPVPLKHPMAWIEVQGYAWAAYQAYLELARKRNSLDSLLEQEIQQRMANLVTGQQRFWLEDEQFPAIALDSEKVPIPVVSSNPGHLLYAGSVEMDQARQLCKRLMQADMLTPWGIRTLSEKAYYYNPLMYHCGAIWPFDNAVTIAGLQRYGFDAEARSITRAVLNAMLAFDNPVELYTVQPSRWLRSHRIEQEWFLADYFYACSVQAWTAAAILYLTAIFM